MSSIIKEIRKQLSDGVPPSSDLAEYEDWLEVIATKRSLGAMVDSALASRKEGRLADAISLITRANRTQLDAIEGIMRVMDAVLKRPKSEVIFAKYRQIFPFEMGVENADEVLDLVSTTQRHISSNNTGIVERLHLMEASQSEETEALKFFYTRFRDGGAEAEIEEAEAKLRSIASDFEAAVSGILRAVMSAVVALLGDQDSGDGISPAHYHLSGWLYQIITSQTLTKAARDVEVG